MNGILDMHIIVTGPESTGKTSMAGFLAKTFGGTVVPEYARVYLTELNRPYALADLEEIAEGQYRLLRAAMTKGARPIVSDTFMLVLQIWAEYRFQKIPPRICDITSQVMPDLYILCKPDIPWEFDVLRENPHDREALYAKYETKVRKSGVPYLVASGTGPGRERLVLKQILEIVEKPYL